MFGKKKQATPFDRYTDPTGEFSNRKLKIGEWYLMHKELLRKIFIYVLIVWNVVTIGIGLFVWGKYLLFDYTRDEQHIAEVARLNLVSPAQIQAHTATPLLFGNLDTWRGRGDTYDFGLEVQNPNDKWIATVTYAIDYGRGISDSNTETILPKEKRWFALFGVDVGGVVGTSRMVVQDIVWQRVETRDVPDPADHILRRVNFAVSDFNFVAAKSEDTTPVNRLMFDVQNNSLFSYWDVPFVVVMWDGSRIVGLAPLHVDKFLAGEIRTIDMSSFVNNLRVQRIELQPVLNVFDSTVYLN